MSDGLANGVDGKLNHTEHDEAREVTAWLDFPDSHKSSDKDIRKVAGYIQTNICHLAVPIQQRTLSFC